MTDPAVALVDVLVCTYRRTELLIKTLDGIARAATAVGAVRIVVVDNDHEQSAREVVRQWALQSTLRIDYLIQPVQNISLTRNAALTSVTAPWIAMIDDDEIPDNNWLASLLVAAENFGADVVFGPVISEFSPDAPVWATRSSLFQRKRFTTGTVIALQEARTGNVLLRASRLTQDMFRFDASLGLSGGEDSEFFSRLSKASYRMIWCDNACVREWTPSNRTTVAWVMKRAFRVGSVEAYNKRRFCRTLDIGVAFMKFSLILTGGGLSTFLWAPFSRSRCIQSMRRAAMGTGFVYGLFCGPYSEYRAVPDDESIS